MTSLAFPFALGPLPDVNIESRGNGDVLTDSATKRSTLKPAIVHEGASKNIQKEWGFEVNVLTITAEHRLLLGVVIGEESDNRPPGLLGSKEFEAI